MIHLLLLIGIGLLISRVIWLIFGIFESLFSTLSRRINASSNQVDASKNNVQKSALGPSKISQPAPPSVVNVGKQKKTSAVPTKLEEPSKPKESASIKNPTTKSDKVQKNENPQNVKKIQPQPEKIPIQEGYRLKLEEKSHEGGLLTNQKREYEQIVIRLNQQIARHQREKQTYIQRIEEIIQHTINQTEHEESRNSTEEQQWQAINNLKHQLNLANRKSQEQKEQITARFENERRQLEQQFDSKQTGSNNPNDDQRIRQYRASIQQLTQRVVELEEEKYKNQSTTPQREELLTNELKVEQQKSLQFSKNNEEKETIVKHFQKEQEQLKGQLEKLKKQLTIKENDQLEIKTKLQAQIKSLQAQKQSLDKQLTEERQSKFRLQNELDSANFRQQHEKKEAQTKENEATQNSDKIYMLEQSVRKEREQREQEQKKYFEIQQELKFVQNQLRNATESQNDLRVKLVKALEGQKKDRSIVKKEDVYMHPEYLNLKKKFQQAEARIISPASDNVSKMSGAVSKSGNEKRELSPTFPNIGSTESRKIATTPPSEMRGAYKSGIGLGGQFRSTITPPMASTILAEKRDKTPPSDRPVAFSTINNEGEEVYLGETNILDEAQRNFIMHELTALKKIKTKKTRLMFSLAQKVNKPIVEYILNAPNIFVIAELANKRIVGAFSQNTFSKDNKFSRSSVVNKAMIFDVIAQVFIANEGKEDIEVIRYEENTLIWGNRQFVINCEEPLSVSVDLKTQNAAYPTIHTTQDFLGSESQTIPISKLQVHRVLFG